MDSQDLNSAGIELAGYIRIVADADAACLVRILRREIPQTVALILSLLPDSSVEQALAGLPSSFAAAVVQRMLSMGSVKEAVARISLRTISNQMSTDVRLPTEEEQRQRLLAIVENLPMAARLPLSGAMSIPQPEQGGGNPAASVLSGAASALAHASFSVGISRQSEQAGQSQPRLIEYAIASPVSSGSEQETPASAIARPPQMIADEDREPSMDEILASIRRIIAEDIEPAYGTHPAESRNQQGNARFAGHGSQRSGQAEAALSMEMDLPVTSLSDAGSDAWTASLRSLDGLSEEELLAAEWASLSLTEPEGTTGQEQARPAPVPARVLNQEEIDRLLGFTMEPEISAIERILANRAPPSLPFPLDDIQTLANQIAKNLKHRLMQVVDHPVDVTVRQVTAVSFSDYMSSVPLPALFSILKAGDHTGSGSMHRRLGTDGLISGSTDGRSGILVTADAAFIYAIVELIQGCVQPAERYSLEGRSFSAVERALIGYVVDTAATAATQTPCDALRARSGYCLSFERVEDDPAFCAIALPAASALHMRMRVDFEGRSGFLDFVIPVDAYEVLWPTRAGGGPASSWHGRLAQVVGQVPVPVEFVLPDLDLTLGQVGELMPGSIISMGRSCMALRGRALTGNREIARGHFLQNNRRWTLVLDPDDRNRDGLDITVFSTKKFMPMASGAAEHGLPMSATSDTGDLAIVMQPPTHKAGQKISSQNIGATVGSLTSIPVKVRVVVAEADVTLEQLLNLQPSQEFGLNREITSLVDLRVSGQTVAQGQLTLTEQGIGIEIVSRQPAQLQA